MTATATTDRRLVGVTITAEEMLDLFRSRVVGDWLKVWRFPELPDETKAVGAEWSGLRRAFVIFLHHESFAAVPEGELVPIVDAVTRTHSMVRLVTERRW